MKTIQFTGTESQLTNLSYAMGLSDNSLPIITETRVYVLNVDILDGVKEAEFSDEDFINMAELEGTVYSLEGFANAFNLEDISSSNDYIRFINVEV